MTAADREFEEIVRRIRLRESFDFNIDRVTTQALDLARSAAEPVDSFNLLVLARVGALMTSDEQAREQAVLATSELLAAALLLLAHYLGDKPK